MSEESHFLQPKLTFAELGIQLVLAQLLQYQKQMCLMLLLILGIDQYVINEHRNELIQELHKHLVHHIHKYAGALVNTNDITVYSYNPYLVVKAVFGISPSRIFN